MNMSEPDNLEPIVEDDTKDTTNANTNDVDVCMAPGASTDAQKLTVDLNRYVGLYTHNKNELVLGILKQANWSE